MPAHDRSSIPRQRIGPAIRRLRRERGLTLDELARAAGVSPSHLSRLERSQTLPSFSVLGRIADALGVSVNDFDRLEHEIAVLDEALGHYLEVLGIDPSDRAEVANLPSETRWRLLDALRSAAETPFIEPERQRHADAESVLSRNAVGERGMSPLWLSRAMVTLARCSGPRLGMWTGPTLLLLPRGSDIRAAFEQALGRIQVDPAVAAWWRDPGHGEAPWRSPDDRSQLIIGSELLAIAADADAPARGPVRDGLRAVLSAIDRGDPVDVALGGEQAPAVNVLLGGHCGIVETLPASGAEPSAVARWLANQDDVGALLSRFRTAWDAVPEHNRRPEVVADRLRALLIR